MAATMKQGLLVRSGGLPYVRRPGARTPLDELGWKGNHSLEFLAFSRARGHTRQAGAGSVGNEVVASSGPAWEGLMQGAGALNTTGRAATARDNHLIGAGQGVDHAGAARFCPQGVCVLGFGRSHEGVQNPGAQINQAPRALDREAVFGQGGGVR